ncbi:diguanylate cyclase [bacterium]|nr:diguanylate cyclase [bacterium]
MAAAGRFVRRYNTFIVAMAIFALLTLRQFQPDLILRPRAHSNFRIWILVLLLAYLVLRLGGFLRSRTEKRPPESEDANLSFLEQADTSFLILAATNVIVQLSGDLQNYFYPLNYLFLSLFVIYLGARIALVYAMLLPAVEMVGMVIEGSPAPLIYTQGILHGGMGVSFVVIIGLFLFTERRARDKAVSKLDRLIADARSLGEPTSDERVAILKETADETEIRHARRLDASIGDLMEVTRLGLNADACVALFIDEYGALLRVRGLAGPPDELDEDAIVPLEGTLAGVAMNQDRAVIVRHMRRNAGALEYRRKRTHVRSCVLQPVRAGGKAIGVIVADSGTEDAFGAASETLIARVARLLAAQFEAAQDMAELDRERAEFAAYYDVAKRFATTNNLQDVLALIFEAGRRVFPYDGAIVTFWDPETRKGSVAAVSGLPERWVGVEFAALESLAGWVVESQRHLAFHRARDINRPVIHPDFRLKGYESVLILPLTSRDRVIGTLTFLWKEEEAFSAYDEKLLEALAVHAATSIDSARVYKQLALLATTDSLTSLPNRRHFRYRLDTEVARFRRTGTPVSLLLLDIDKFKGINDRYGHPVGDVVLKRMAEELSNAMRDIDVAARYGGEEFALVLSNTRIAGARKFADRLRERIAKIRIDNENGAFSITISIGIAGMPEDARDARALIDAADRALYHSKETGRNRVSWIGDVPDAPALPPANASNA